MSIAQLEQGILERPWTTPLRTLKPVVERPLHDSTTSSKSDAKSVLDEIRIKLVTEKKYSKVVVAGDQQSFGNMVRLLVPSQRELPTLGEASWQARAPASFVDPSSK